MGGNATFGEIIPYLLDGKRKLNEISHAVDFYGANISGFLSEKLKAY